MSPRHRRAVLACLAGAALAIGASLTLAGIGVFRVARRTLEIFSGDHVEPLPASDFTALVLLAVGLLLALGAAALAVAGRRAALALERASLIEIRA
jgi:hypothetical protein